MKRAGLLVAASLALLTADAHADPLAPASVTLAVTPGSAGGPWKLVVKNEGELPVRIAADARLLVLDLVPQNPTPKLPSVRCVLPADARPSGDEGRELVVPAKRSWSASFDPLFYCFGAKERALLVPGTTVKARFGWPEPLVASKKAKKPAGPTAPFAVSPVGAAVGQLAPAKALEASSFTLTEAVTVAPPPASAAAASAPSEGVTTEATKPPVAIRASEAVDVARGGDVPMTVTLANESDRAVTTFFRASTLAFTVNGPAGSVSCGTPRSTPEPFRELFTTIGAKQKTSTTLLVSALCPDGTFDEAGIYRVVPKLDTRGTSGRNIGLKTWDGEVSAQAPSLVRVRASRRPAAPTKPQLD